MDKEILVYVDVSGTPHLAGRLWTRVRNGRESASFEYDRSWLEHKDSFSMEPALQLMSGPFHTAGDRPIFGSIGDSAPDRWGRVIMRRNERRRAERERETPRTLMEIDYLLGVDDEARQGALRFADVGGGPFLATHGPDRIPPLIELPRLHSAADHMTSESDSDEDLRLLLAPGSSLGGSRPKTSVRDKDGTLAIAKFPHSEDAIDAVRWEAVALTLAAKSGISVPKWRLENVANKPVLLMQRFDRSDGHRIPFLSAMSMLDAIDNEKRSYLEFVDILRQHGAAPREDMQALWRRIAFNIMISNTDDHLRNHGFLYEGPDGWRLAPAYDLNPVPVDIKPHILTTTIDFDDGTASIDLAMSVAEHFDLTADNARAIVTEVEKAVSQWRKTASILGIGSDEIDRMALAFEHSESGLSPTPKKLSNENPLRLADNKAISQATKGVSTWPEERLRVAHAATAAALSQAHNKSPEAALGLLETKAGMEVLNREMKRRGIEAAPKTAQAAGKRKNQGRER